MTKLLFLVFALLTVVGSHLVQTPTTLVFTTPHTTTITSWSVDSTHQYETAGNIASVAWDDSNEYLQAGFNPQ